MYFYTPDITQKIAFCIVGVGPLQVRSHRGAVDLGDPAFFSKQIYVFIIEQKIVS